MRKIVTVLGLVLPLACAESESRTQQSQPLASDVEPLANPFPDPPPNAPAPAASCGDMNGGGDQHVDFDALRKHGLLKGSAKAAWRLLRCNPWSHGGVDFA